MYYENSLYADAINLLILYMCQMFVRYQRMLKMKNKIGTVCFDNKGYKIFSRTMSLLLIIVFITAMLTPYNVLGAENDTDINDAVSEPTHSESLIPEEKMFFYGAEKKDFFLESNFMKVSFEASDNLVSVTEFKNVSSGVEWIKDFSCAELSSIYYDDKNVMHDFEWQYFGCYISDMSPELIFEFQSKDKKFTCRQEWYICNTNEDGSVLMMTSWIESTAEYVITLPDSFSCAKLSLVSAEGNSVQYLDGAVKNEVVTEEKVVNFSIGNSNGFDMSVPLFYFNSMDGHGIAVGSGAFTPEKTSVLNVAVSDKSIVLNSSAEFNMIENDTGILYVLPSLFFAVYDGNDSVGKNLIKNSTVSDLSDKYGSLPLTYENTVGSLNVENVQSLRENFYNMLFYFSVGDACKTSGAFIKDELSLCKDDDSSMYKYILRSAVFSDFDYTKVGLTDGTAIKKSAAEHDELYRNRLASIMLSGRQYPIFDGYSSDGWDGIEFYDSVNKKGAIFVFRNDAESEYERLIAVQGVEAEVEYKVSSVDGSVDIERITGAEILSGGLNVSLKDGAMSEIIFIEEADVDFADVKILLFGSELSPLELIAIASVFILIIGIVIVAIIINAEDEYKEKKF